MEQEQLLSQIALRIEQSEKRILAEVQGLSQRLDRLDQREESHYQSVVSAVGDVVEVLGERMKEQDERRARELEEMKLVVGQNSYDILALKQRL